MHGWENFYVMAGTAAATLTGLLFVVITLGIQLSASHAAHGIHAFVTPTLVHFGGVLLQAMAVLAPWPSASPLGGILVVCGVIGLTYVTFVIRKLRGLDFVSPDLGTWIAYASAPGVAHVCLIAGAVGLLEERPFAPYTVAAATTLLLFVGIRDAWGLTLWIVEDRLRGSARVARKHRARPEGSPG